ncbi:MAG: hypothetical protein LUF04_12940 [Bacteroides sp.]|nr:hypothetical protein [Bacteroides sp.]
MKKMLIAALWLFLVGSLVSCSKDENTPPEIEPEVPNISMVENTILISDIAGLPEDDFFDKVQVEISGSCWEIIEGIEAAYEDGKITLELPTEFSAEQLSQVVRSHSTDYCGFWPATSDDTEALVAGLGDIIAYKDGQKVGMLSLTDWSGEGSVAGKYFVYYQYADRPFTLSGYSSTYRYEASFKTGWNAYAYVSLTEEGTAICTTSIPEEAPLTWYFKSWVY